MRKQALVLALVLVTTACSGGGDDDGSTTSRAPSASSTTTVRAVEPVRVLTLNVLHGLFCAQETDFCQAPDRAVMVARAIEAADCPELVGFQEIGPRRPAVVPPAMDEVCEGRYELAWEGINSPDRTMVFTTLPIRDHAFLDLASFPWEAYRVRVDTPIGPVDFLHHPLREQLQQPCVRGRRVPPGVPDGDHRERVPRDRGRCRARRPARWRGAPNCVGGLQRRAGEPDPGDAQGGRFYRCPGRRAGAGVRRGDRPWVHGGPRRPENLLDGLDVPGGRYRERIDYVLARPGKDCTLDAAVEPFASEPLSNPFHGLYWPSDHGGVLAELTCD